MQPFVTSLRAIVLVLGLAALAILINRMVLEAGLQQALLLRQQWLPGAVFISQVMANFTYAVSLCLLAFIVARRYWRALFPARLNILIVALCFVAGLVFAVFLNHPMHVLLFGVFFENPTLGVGAVSDSVVGGIFSGIRQSQALLTMPVLATVVATPIVEELTDRGILFKEAEQLAAWQVALLSLLLFCLLHYEVGGMAKVLALVPAAVLFVSVRMLTGSFVYSAAAHIGINLAAYLKLQAW